MPALVIIAIRSRYMSESPVWAANQGNLKEAASILRQSYNINAHVPQDALDQPAPVVNKAKWSNYLNLFRGIYLRRTTLATLLSVVSSFAYNAVAFGLPVIMNPIMLIPFNLVPLVLVTVQYAAMKIGAVAVTTGVFIPWTLPPVISGFIVTGHLSGSVMQLINLLIGAMLYLPFMRILDKQYRAAEIASVTQTDTTLAKQE